MDVLIVEEGNKENFKPQTKIPRRSMGENRKDQQALVNVNSNTEKVGGLCSGLKKIAIDDNSTAKVTPSLEFVKVSKVNHIANDSKNDIVISTEDLSTTKAFTRTSPKKTISKLPTSKGHPNPTVKSTKFTIFEDKVVDRSEQRGSQSDRRARRKERKAKKMVITDVATSNLEDVYIKGPEVMADEFGIPEVERCGSNPMNNKKGFRKDVSDLITTTDLTVMVEEKHVDDEQVNTNKVDNPVEKTCDTNDRRIGVEVVDMLQALVDSLTATIAADTVPDSDAVVTTMNKIYGNNSSPGNKHSTAGPAEERKLVAKKASPLHSTSTPASESNLEKAGKIDFTETYNSSSGNLHRTDGPAEERKRATKRGSKGGKIDFTETYNATPAGLVDLVETEPDSGATIISDHFIQQGKLADNDVASALQINDFSPSTLSTWILVFMNTTNLHDSWACNQVCTVIMQVTEKHAIDICSDDNNTWVEVVGEFFEKILSIHHGNGEVCLAIMSALISMVRTKKTLSSTLTKYVDMPRVVKILNQYDILKEMFASTCEYVKLVVAEFDKDIFETACTPWLTEAYTSVRKILPLHEACPLSITVAFDTMTCINQISSMADMNLENYGDVEFVLRLNSIHPDNDEVNRAALDSISSIYEKQQCSNNQLSESSIETPSLQQLEVVAQLIKNSLCLDSVSKSALYAMQTFSKFSPSMDMLFAKNALTVPVVNILKGQSTIDLALSKTIMDCLSSLSQDNFTDQMVLGSLPECLVMNLERHCNNEAMLDSTCNAIANLARNNSANQRKFHLAGTCKNLVHYAMNEGVIHDIQLCQSALLAVESLSKCNKNIQLEFQKLEATKNIQSIILTHKGNFAVVELAQTALYSLSLGTVFMHACLNHPFLKYVCFISAFAVLANVMLSPAAIGSLSVECESAFFVSRLVFSYILNSIILNSKIIHVTGRFEASNDVLTFIFAAAVTCALFPSVGPNHSFSLFWYYFPMFAKFTSTKLATLVTSNDVM